MIFVKRVVFLQCLLYFYFSTVKKLYQYYHQHHHHNNFNITKISRMPCFFANAAFIDNEKKPTGYRDHYEMTRLLKRLADTYSNRAYMYSIGNSTAGREIWVVALAEHSPDVHIPMRPEAIYIGNMHGDEAVGRELLLYLITYMLEMYEFDSYVREIMNSTRLHVLPSMNPDGFVAAKEGVCDGSSGRENANNVDLNRNFPDIWRKRTATGIGNNKSAIRNKFKKKTNEIQPESESVLKLLEKINFVLAANFHGGALVANYPLDSNRERITGYSKAPDDDMLKHLALTYSKSHKIMHAGYPCEKSDEEFPNGITNGAEWYSVVGSLQDYQYVYKGTMALTMEISCCKYPPANFIPTYWSENKDAMLNFLKEIHRGVKGYVFDESGNGIKTKLQIAGRNSFFHSDDSGEYYRMLLPGLYTLMVNGTEKYKAKEVTFLIPDIRPLVILNISVESAKPSVNFTNEELHKTVYDISKLPTVKTLDPIFNFIGNTIVTSTTIVQITTNDHAKTTGHSPSIDYETLTATIGYGHHEQRAENRTHSNDINLLAVGLTRFAITPKNSTPVDSRTYVNKKAENSNFNNGQAKFCSKNIMFLYTISSTILVIHVILRLYYTVFS